MKDLNQLSLVGRLTKDAELKDGRLEFSIAFNNTKKDESGNWIDESNFLNLNLFGKIADALSTKLVKGTQVIIGGHLKQNRWEKDGQKHSALNVIVDEIQIVGGSKKSESNQSTFQPSPSVNNSADQSNEFAEDIPF